jgi:hypothetical protein
MSIITGVRTPEKPRTDGMRRGRYLDTRPKGNSPGELEERARERGLEYFGQFATLELDEDYGALDRWDNLFTGEPPDPRYKGFIRVYELVPEVEA